MEEKTLRLIEVIGTWLSGLGSLLAVVVALYLARRQTSVQLDVGAGRRLVIAPGIKKPSEVINIYIINKGERPVVIANVLWKFGIIKRRHAVQALGSPMDSIKIHGILEPGHQGNFYIDYDSNDKDNWINRWSKDVPSQLQRLWAERMRVGIATAVGKTIWAPVEKNLTDKIIAASQENDIGKTARLPLDLLDRLLARCYRAIKNN